MSLIFIIIYIAFWCGLTGRSRKLLYFFLCTKRYFFPSFSSIINIIEAGESERKETSAFCICKVEKNHRGVSEGSFWKIISYVVYFLYFFYAMWPTQSHSLSHSSSAVCFSFSRLISNVMSKSRFL